MIFTFEQFNEKEEHDRLLYEDIDAYCEIYVEEEEVLVLEEKGKSYERLKDGKIKYRDEIFPGFNKPKKYSGKGKFKKRVLAKEGDEIKVLNYGHRDYSDYTKHKDPKRRSNFRKRHKCKTAKSRLTKRYWACKDLW
jgi:hypothetical protein